MPEFGDMVLRGEKLATGSTVDLDNRTITSMHRVKTSKESAAAMYCRTVFNLAAAPDEFIWLTAARGFVIDQQRDARDADDFDSFGDCTLVYPEHFVRSRRAAKPSLKSATSYMMTLTPEKRLALIEKMNAEEAAATDAEFIGETTERDDVDAEIDAITAELLAAENDD